MGVINKVVLLIVFIVALVPRNSFGQEITILDKITQERIPGALIYSNNPNIKVRGNTEGRFMLDAFKGCDSVFISYPEYEIYISSYMLLSKTITLELSEKALSVSEMVVTASRWGENQAKTSSRITKLNLKELGLLEPQTSADLLESTGYVFVQKSQFAGGSPQLRGFGTNRVMIVVDGVRMNNAIFRSGNLQNVISLDGNSLESAEIQFGPGSVIYGSDAIGGVMNFTTKLAKYSPDSTRSFVKTKLFTRYSSASNESTSHLGFNYGRKKWAFFTGATFSRFGDLKTGKYGNNSFLRPTYQSTVNGVDTTIANNDPRLQINSGYAQFNILQKISFKPNEKWEVNYGFNFSKSTDAPRYDRLIQDADGDGQLDKAEWYYGPQEWMMHRITVLNTPENKKIYHNLRITAAYQKQLESRHDRKMGSNQIRHQFETVNALSLNVDFTKKIKKRTTIYYGTEGVFNKVGSNAYRESITDGTQDVINPRYPNNSIWQTYGVYANLKFELTEKWIFNTGARYSVYGINAEFDTSLFAFPVTRLSNSNSALNGTVGLVYNPNNKMRLYLNVSTGFRAPNIDDIGKVFDSEHGSVIVPNIDLKPEYAYNAEIGFVKTFSGVVKVDGAVYYTYLYDALARSAFLFGGEDSILYEGVMSQVLAVQNISNAYVYGVQGGVEILLGKGFSIKSMISYQKGFEYSLDSMGYFPKTHVAPTFGRTSLSFKKRHIYLSLYAVYHGEMKHKDLPLQERNDHVYAKDNDGNAYTPSWYTLNFKGAYFFNKHLSLNIGVENITNQLYRTFGSGFSGAGINVITSVKVTF